MMTIGAQPFDVRSAAATPAAEPAGSIAATGGAAAAGNGEGGIGPGGGSRETRALMFVDRVGSTMIRAALGDERADRLQHRHDRLVHGALLRHRGQIVKHTGDGLMAVFVSCGAALRAAVEAQQVIARFRGGPDERLAIRIGISVGDVLCEGGDYFGIAVVEAQRLESSAESGEIRCADLVLQVAKGTSHVSTRSIGELALKGLAGPLACSVVEWAPTGTSGRSTGELQALLRVPTDYDLVGRDDQLERLDALLDEVVEQSGFGLALIAGEPGIGKTRLAFELAGHALDHGALVLAGHSNEGLGTAYQTFIDALRWFVQRIHDPAAPRTLGANPDRLLTLMDDVVGPIATGNRATAFGGSMDRESLFDAISSWLSCAGGGRAVCLVLDDLHWADDETLLVVEHIARRRPDRLLMIITYRDTEVAEGSVLKRLIRDLDRDRVTHLRLAGLSVADVGRLALVADQATLIDGPASLHARTNGNPLFVGEYLRHLAATGNTRDTANTGAPGDTVSDEPPASVRDIIGRRVAWIDDRANEALTVAAVIGGEFDLATVAEVSRIPIDRLIGLLDRASDGRLIEEVGVGSYRFAHPLIRSSLSDSASPTKRAQLHSVIAAVLEAATDDRSVDRLSRLVHHWRAAAPLVGHRMAVERSLDAGRSALARFAPIEAAAHFRYAALHDLDPVGRVAATLDAGVAELRAGVRDHRETLLDAARQATIVGEMDLLVRALVASGRWGYTTLGEPDHEKIAALTDALSRVPDNRPDLRADLSAALAVELVFEGHGEQRSLLCDEAIALAATCDIAAVKASVSVRVNQVAPRRHSSVKHRRRLVATTVEGIEAARSTGDHEAIVRNLNNGFFTFLQFGLVEPAMSCARDLIDLVTRTADPFTRRHVDMFEPVLDLLAGDLDASSTRSRQVFERWTADGVPEAAGFWAVERFALGREFDRLAGLADKWDSTVGASTPAGLANAMYAVAAAHSNDVINARAAIDRAAVDRFAGVPDDAVWLVANILWADAAIAVQDDTAMADLTEILSSWSGCLGITGGLFVGAVDRVLGRMARVQGDLTAARRFLARAEDVHRDMQSPVWIARSILDRAEVELDADHQSSDDPSASDLLNEAASTLDGHNLVALANRLASLRQRT